MKKIQFLPLMALVLGLGLTVSMSAFKSATTLVAPTSGWYQVSPSGVIDPSNIGPIATPPESSLSACARKNLGNTCAVELLFSSSATTIPATYADIATTPGVTNNDQAKLPE